MHVDQDPDGGFSNPRMHPYTAMRPGQPSFVDFKQHPELISEVLEDFVPFAQTPAVRAFYGLLSWLNGPASLLESCDCALRPPEPHESGLSQLPLRVHGRLMLMYRDLAANCDERFSALYNTVGRQLSGVDPEFPREQGSVCVAASKTLFRDLLPANVRSSTHVVTRDGEAGRGFQLMLVFQAFGNDEAAAFTTLNRVFKNIELAIRGASGGLAATLSSGRDSRVE